MNLIFRIAAINPCSNIHLDIDECKFNEELIRKDNDTSKSICKCAFDGMKGCKATCINTIGSYKCACNAGYRLVANRVCTDVDECRAGTHDCDQICLNTRNGFQCGCHPGFKLADDGKTCLGQHFPTFNHFDHMQCLMGYH